MKNLDMVYFREQRAIRTSLLVHMATAARVKYLAACCGVFDLFIQKVVKFRQLLLEAPNISGRNCVTVFII